MAKKNKVKISPIDFTFKAIIMLILIVYTISIFFVVFWGLLNSLKSLDDFYSQTLSFPKLGVMPVEAEDYYEALKFGNYVTVFKEFTYTKEVSYFTMFSDVPVGIRTDANIFTMLFNTLYSAGFCSILGVLINYIVAYLAAKYKFKFSAVLYGYVIATMSIPLVGTTPAMIDMLQKLGFFSSYGGLLAMKAGWGGMYFLVFYAFFEGLPDSYTEAAEIDGASQLNILIRIIMPLGVKMIGTIGLIIFVANWNDYNTSFVYMPAIPTLAFGIYNLAHKAASKPLFQGLVYKVAGCMILVLPILILFILAKDKIMGNISAGGLKG